MNINEAGADITASNSSKKSRVSIEEARAKLQNIKEEVESEHLQTL